MTVLPNAFGPSTMEQLQPYVHALKDLGFACTEGLASVMAQETLSLCPLLTSPSAPRIKAIDIIQGSSWMCLGNQDFEACLCFDPLTIELTQPVVFDRPSKLGLEELFLDWFAKPGSADRPFFQETTDLRLENRPSSYLPRYSAMEGRTRDKLDPEALGVLGGIWSTGCQGPGR